MHANIPLLALTLLAKTELPMGNPAALEERLAIQVLAAYDSSRGGFVTKSGVPVESAISLALSRARDPQWSGRARLTLTWMRSLMDTLTGGTFHGGHGDDPGADMVDKRADSNGRRLEALIEGWRALDEDDFRRDASRLVDWFERVLQDGRGGFVSAQVGDQDLEPRSNGYAIRAWLQWSAATLDLRRRDFGLRSLDRLWETCWSDGRGLIRKNSFGEELDEPQLSDQVEMGRAYVLAARLCGRSRDTERARALGDLVLARFADREGGFRTQSKPDKDGSIKKAARVPTENARAALFLAELAALTGDARFRQSAAQCWASFPKELGKLGLGAADWALAIAAAEHPRLPEAPRWPAQDPTTKKFRRSVSFRTGH